MGKKSFGKAIAGLGAVMAGYAKGRMLYEDREFEKEKRARERLKWEDEDQVRADKKAEREAFKSGMTEGPPMSNGVRQPNVPAMSPDPETPSPGSALEQQSLMPSEQAPSGATGGLANAPKTPTMLAHAQRLLNGYESAMASASQRGDMQGFVRNFEASAKVRAVAREQMREEADRQHVLLGGTDFSMYAKIYNDMVADGTSIDVQTDKDGGYRLVGVGRDGSQIDRKVNDAQEMRGLVNQLFDPKAMRQLEMQRAAKLWEADLDVRKQTAIKAVEAAHSKDLETHKTRLKEPEVVKRSMGEGKPDQIGTLKDGKINWQTPDGNVHPGGEPLDKKTTDAMRTTIMGLYRVADMDSMSPDIRQKVGSALTFGSQLLQSNQGMESGRRLDINTAAKIASDLADGTLKETRFRDKDGNEWRGVEFGGVKYVLDPTPIKKQPEQPENRIASGKIGDASWGKVSKEEQAKRDKIAGELIIKEHGSVEEAKAALADIERELSKVKNGTQRKVLEAERNKIKAGLAAVEGKQAAPKEALAYLKANPHTAPEFKKKYGYLPEES